MDVRHTQVVLLLTQVRLYRLPARSHQADSTRYQLSLLRYEHSPTFSSRSPNIGLWIILISLILWLDNQSSRAIPNNTSQRVSNK